MFDLSTVLVLIFGAYCVGFANGQRAAMRKPPNAKADLPPTGARQPRSGTEGGNGG